MKVKPVLFVILLLQFFVLIAGCETTKDAAAGIGKDVAKDARYTLSALAKVDKWIKENLW